VASGPTSVSESVGSPTRSACIRSVNFDTNSSYPSVWAMNRFAAMQDWPLFWTRAVEGGAFGPVVANFRHALEMTAIDQVVQFRRHPLGKL